MGYKVQYDRISSLKEVRAERRRIDCELAETREKLMGDYECLTEVFTVGFWTNLAQEKMAAFLPASSWVTMGYGLVSSLMKNHKKRKRKKKKRRALAALSED